MTAKHTIGVALALLAVAPCFAERNNGAATGDGYSSADHVLVTFPSRPRLLSRRAGSGFKGYVGGRYDDNITIEYLTRRLSEDYPLSAVEDWPIAALDIHCVVYRVAPRKPVDDLLARLSDDPRIESAQRLNRFDVQTDSTPAGDGYNDPYHKLQDTWRELGLAEAHRVATGRGVTVAVIDTAVEREHPDLHERIRRSESFVVSAVRSAGDFHGTAVAGVLAAAADNRQGIVGVAPDTNLLALEACWSTNEGAQCNSFTLAQALNYAIENGAQIINLSLAGPDDPLLERLVKAALKRDIVVVAADSGRQNRPFPASVPGVIAVDRGGGDKTATAGARDGAKVAGPGREVLTTVPGQSYDFASGTSIAAAHVSGIIALLFQLKSSNDIADLGRLMRTAVAPETGGVVNACKLLKAAVLGTPDDALLHCRHSTLVAR